MASSSISSIIYMVLAAAVSSSYGTNLPIPGDDMVAISYRIIGDRIEFTLLSEIPPISNTGRWVGIGFSRGEGMTGADIFVGVPTATDRRYGRDLYTIGHGLVGRDDARNDWTVISASNDGDRARVVASRLLDTGDTEGDLVIENRNMSIIYATGYSQNNDLYMHGQARGQLYFNLIREYQEEGSTTTQGPTAEPSTEGPTTPTGSPGPTSSLAPIIEPITGIPTTIVPSTSGPTSTSGSGPIVEPITGIPTTIVPSTSGPTSTSGSGPIGEPITGIPTTIVPSTSGPTSTSGSGPIVEPITGIPTTIVPSTTGPTSTSGSGPIVEPITGIPTTIVPSTSGPTSTSGSGPIVEPITGIPTAPSISGPKQIPQIRKVMDYHNQRKL